MQSITIKAVDKLLNVHVFTDQLTMLGINFSLPSLTVYGIVFVEKHLDGEGGDNGLEIARGVYRISCTNQSVPQDHKSVTFSHSVISLNQLLQNFKNTAYIFLTFRNHVKIFLSQNILQNISNVVYRTTLSIRTERLTNSEDTVKIRVFTVCHSIC